MKKILLLAGALLLSAASLFADDDVTILDGDASILKTKATAKVVFDYTGTYVGEDGARTQTLNQYLQSRGAEFVKDWPSDHKQAEGYFIKYFNKYNKKGMTIADDGEYTIEIKVETLDMGNAGAAVFAGFGNKPGGAILWGKIFVKDAGGNILLTLSANAVKGQGTYSETARLGLCYQWLSYYMAKKIKVKK